MSRAEFLQGSMVALLTPMSADEQIDYPSFERLVDLHVDAGTSAIVVASTTGEGPTLSLSMSTCTFTGVPFSTQLAGFRSSRGWDRRRPGSHANSPERLSTSRSMPFSV